MTFAPRASDTAVLVQYIQKTLGSDWAAWPGGWPGEVEAALLDAVLSARSRYGTPTTGVRGAIKRYRESVGEDGLPLNTLGRLANVDAEQLAGVLHNRQRVAGRLKTQAIGEAAQRLQAAGVQHAADLDASSTAHRKAYVGVHGLGSVTWTYFTMLLGRPGVKADTWIIRFVKAALERTVGAPEAEVLVSAAAVTLGVSQTALDHAIWSQVRSS